MKFDTQNLKVSIFARKEPAPLDDESMHQLVLMFEQLDEYSFEANADLDVYVNFPNHYLDADQVDDLKELTQFTGCKIKSHSFTMLLIQTAQGKLITVHFNGSFLNGSFMKDVAVAMAESEFKKNNKYSNETGKDDDSADDDEEHFSLTQEINF